MYIFNSSTNTLNSIVPSNLRHSQVSQQVAFLSISDSDSGDDHLSDEPIKIAASLYEIFSSQVAFRSQRLIRR